MKTPLFLSDLGAKAVGVLDPEVAHRLTVKALAAGFGPRVNVDNARLAVSMAGLNFPNPVGLAAGFDKNGEAINPLFGLGFGFVEVGAVTPLAQPGNERPRVFRLRSDAAVINRYGFNNDGLEAFATRLEGCKRMGIVGANLGANKDSKDRVEDYVTSISRLAGLVDFYTVNISSPNTPGLRALQDRASLSELLSRVLAARDATKVRTPLFLKIAPDLTDEDKADICVVVKEAAPDGLIVSNTTIARPSSLSSTHAGEAGGLSGKPLFAPSTAVLREIYGVLGNSVPLIGVGGVSSARDAYEKILSGATLVQLYSALVYEGPSLVATILKELPNFLDADGYSSISQAIGAGVN